MELDIYREANSINFAESDAENYKIIFGKAVKKLRLLMRFSVAEVSGFSGLTKNMVTKFENGSSSSEAFYDFSPKLIRFYRKSIDGFFDSKDPYFAWLFVDDLNYPYNIRKNIDKFVAFLNEKPEWTCPIKIRKK